MDDRAQQFLFVTLPDAQVEESAKTPITVVVNWTATLGRK
jgi:hypothetical protein